MFAFFFFNYTATTEIYSLSLHDALPIWRRSGGRVLPDRVGRAQRERVPAVLRTARRGVRAPGRRVEQFVERDRKSTRLNSSHSQISYAVFCLKKKKTSLPPMYTVSYNPL